MELLAHFLVVDVLAVQAVGARLASRVIDSRSVALAAVSTVFVAPLAWSRLPVLQHHSRSSALLAARVKVNGYKL